MDSGLARAQAAYDRAEPPDGDQEALDRWCDTYDTPKNRQALADYMAEGAVGDVEGPLLREDGLADVIKDWLDHKPSESVVAAMAAVYPNVESYAQARRNHGAAEHARAMLAAWDGPIPTFEDFANPGDPNEGDPPDPDR